MIIGFSGIIYWILLFGFPDLMIGGFVDEENLLVKHEAKLPLFIFLAVYMIFNLIISGGQFYRMAKKVEGKMRIRCLEIVYGFILFTIGNTLDMIVPVGLYLIPIRICVAISYLMMFHGFLIHKD